MVMNETEPISAALQRLDQALESLEKSVDIRLERESTLVDAEAEVQRMSADRVRLAEALDAAQERSQQLEHVNKEVSRRLVNSMEAIKNVIDQQNNSQENAT